MHATHSEDPPLVRVHDEVTLRLMVESAPIAIVAVDQQGRILLANNKLAEMFGYTLAELEGKAIETLIPERFREGHGLYRSEYIVSPRVRPMGSGFDLSGRRKDGSEFPLEVGLSHLHSDGHLLIMATVADITRRKQNEEMLERRVQERTREIERRRQVADSLRDILAILNSNRPLQEILDHIVAQSSALLKADASAIYQLQDSDAAVVIEASYGLSPLQLAPPQQPHVAAFDQLVSGNVVSGNVVSGNVVSGNVVSGNVVSGNSPVAIADAGHEATPEAAPPTYCAQLAVPLAIKDEIYGCLTLFYVEPRKFTPEEIELAVMFGDQAVLAIENARLRAQAERTAVAAERNRIARDLHDSVTQTLFSATLIAEVLPKLVKRNSEDGIRRLEELRQLTRGALAEMRTLLLELRPATLTEVSVEELLRQLTEAARGRARIPIALQMEAASPLPPEVKIAFYYIAQEALNNVAKHARAQQIWVKLVSHPDQAELTVTDDGQGFDRAQVTAEHLGLAIMRERTESIGGRLEVRSAPGQGTTILIHWSNPEMGK